MKALIVEFQEVFDRSLAMRVVHQDDSLIERGTGELISVDGFCIMTQRRPEIDTTGSIYIGGTGTEYDGTKSLAHFGTPEYRAEYLAKARSAIDALNEKLGSQVEEVKPAQIIAPVHLGYGEIANKSMFRLADGTTAYIEPGKGRIGKRRKVWSHIKINLEQLEDFSKSHDVLSIAPWGNALSTVVVFYVKEEK